MYALHSRVSLILLILHTLTTIDIVAHLGMTVTAMSYSSDSDSQGAAKISPAQARSDAFFSLNLKAIQSSLQAKLRQTQMFTAIHSTQRPR